MVLAQTALFIEDVHCVEQGHRLAKQFNFRLVASYPDDQCVLVFKQGRLELHPADKKMKPIYVDFQAPNRQERLQKSRGRSELIARAVGVRGHYRPTIIDATAGLGNDAVVLAHAGCCVQMIERSPVVFVLLEDGIRRAASCQYEWIARVQLTWGDANHFLHQRIMANQLVDVVYVDTMFPERTKSALAKKEMRILKDLVGMDEDAHALFSLAKHCARKRVVVKRPKYAPPITADKPSVVYRGKVCRFDVYLHT